MFIFLVRNLAEILVMTCKRHDYDMQILLFLRICKCKCHTPGKGPHKFHKPLLWLGINPGPQDTIGETIGFGIHLNPPKDILRLLLTMSMQLRPTTIILRLLFSYFVFKSSKIASIIRCSCTFVMKTNIKCLIKLPRYI